jgi:hypothetical protein
MVGYEMLANAQRDVTPENGQEEPQRTKKSIPFGVVCFVVLSVLCDLPICISYSSN